MPLSRSPIRTRSANVPSEDIERDPLREDDRSRAAQPSNTIVTTEYLEKALLELQCITINIRERVLLELQQLAAKSQREMMEKMISTFAQMQVQTAAANSRAALVQDTAADPAHSQSLRRLTLTSFNMNSVAKELLKQVPNFNGNMSSPQLLRIRSRGWDHHLMAPWPNGHSSYKVTFFPHNKKKQIQYCFEEVSEEGVLLQPMAAAAEDRRWLSSVPNSSVSAVATRGVAPASLHPQHSPRYVCQLGEPYIHSFNFSAFTPDLVTHPPLLYILYSESLDEFGE
ncbi:hypothetical protein BDZ88DRAFT_471613, partial [Geranomyces variabilis]